MDGGRTTVSRRYEALMPNQNTAIQLGAQPVKRDAVVVPVRFVAAGRVIQSTSRELNESCVFIRCVNPPPMNVIVGLKIYLPGAPEAIGATAVVRASVPGGPFSGFRADFADLDATAAARLVTFLREDGREQLNRRSARRVPSSIRIGVASDDEFIEQHAANISAGGMFIRMRDPLPLNSVLTLYLELPDGGPAAVVDAQVVRVAQPGHDPLSGVGVQFIGADDEFRRRVDAYIDTLLDG
jgi:uncharacterized protein (TIGR02266 family)